MLYSLLHKLALSMWPDPALQSTFDASSAARPAHIGGVDHMPRTILIAQALKARQEALRVHNMPKEATPNSEVMRTILNSLRDQFKAEHIAQRPTERLREYHRRVRSAFHAYVFQAMTASHSYVEFNR